ncbi:MAG: sigma-70 family RNA polymerase sigma factor [Succinivibrio sp.]|nr:sigma-70 family RNA polymerase sigma factor [Succinivibrio sp.]
MKSAANAVDLSDNELVKRVQGGEIAAYNVLVIRYQHKVRQIALKICGNEADSGDIAQEAFLKAYKALGSFRGESAFYTWLYRITVNVARSYLESSAKNRNHVDVDGEDIEAQDIRGALVTGDTPDRIIESEELHRAIFTALGELAPELKQALTLREVEGLSYEEIAALTHVPIGTVRSRIFRARQYIEERMTELEV